MQGRPVKLGSDSSLQQRLLTKWNLLKEDLDYKFNKNMESKRFQLNKEDGKKILKGAGIAMSGALLTYLLSVIPNIDFGEATPIVVAVSSILINAGLKFISGQK